MTERRSRRDALAIGAATVGAVTAVSAAGCSGEEPTRLMKVDELPIGRPTLVQRPDGRTMPGREHEQLIIVRPDEQTVRAYSNICTHGECLVKPKGKTLHCFCHDADYDPLTGKVLAGPPPKPLATVDVHVADGWVLTGSA
jgi:cytochrome b6-f complex iron-sulfur subunit